MTMSTTPTTPTPTPTTTKKKAAAHVTLKYGLCTLAATVIVFYVRGLTHNALTPEMATAVALVLAQSLAAALQATGQVDVPDAPVQIDLSGLVAQLAPLVEASATRGSAAGAAAAMQAALTPSTPDTPDTLEGPDAGAAPEPAPAAAAAAAATTTA